MIPARGPQTTLKEACDEHTCQQVLRASHLLTMSVFWSYRLGKSRQV